MDHKSTIATDRRGGKAGVPVEEAVERYVVPEKYKTFRQFSWDFCIGRTIEQFYAEWSGKPGRVLNYS